jgi:hypothetical protein
MRENPQSEFISEPIKPVELGVGTTVVAGEPILPHSFVWRGQTYIVDQVIEKWKESSPCRNGANEMYVRKHWYRIRTTDGLVMDIYFERQPASKRQAKQRWWLYTVTTSGDS